MMTKKYNGGNLRLGRVLARNSAYTRYFVTYTSGALRISGIMNIPTGMGPYPALVLNHGHIDTDIYTNGRGLAASRTTSLGVVTSSCTPTTATMPSPPTIRGTSSTCGSATPRTRSTPYWRCGRRSCRPWTPGASGCSGARWVAASPTT
jgi:hypothetical protein